MVELRRDTHAPDLAPTATALASLLDAVGVG